VKNWPHFIEIPNKPTFRPDEIASILSLSRRTIYRMIERGTLQSFRVSGSVRIPRQAIFTACTPHL